jgi:hypothetical protein
MAARFYPTPSTCTYTLHKSNKYSDRHGGDAMLVDDMYRVDFQRRISHQPIYGYDDTQFGFVAQGKELVTGNMIINFRYPGYLRNLIMALAIDAQRERREYAEKMENAPSRLNDVFAENNIEMLAEQIESLEGSADKLKAIGNYMTINRKPRGGSNTVASALAGQLGIGVGSPHKKGSLTTIHHSSAQATNSILAVVEALQDRFVRKYSRDDLGDRMTAGGRAKNISSPLDIPVNQMTFDMSVKYGNNSSSNFVRIFKDCYITGEEETVSASAGVGNDLSSSAQPILEVYPFFCRTITTQGD